MFPSDKSGNASSLGTVVNYPRHKNKLGEKKNIEMNAFTIAPCCISQEPKRQLQASHVNDCQQFLLLFWYVLMRPRCRMWCPFLFLFTPSSAQILFFSWFINNNPSWLHINHNTSLATVNVVPKHCWRRMIHFVIERSITNLKTTWWRRARLQRPSWDVRRKSWVVDVRPGLPQLLLWWGRFMSHCCDVCCSIKALIQWPG